MKMENRTATVSVIMRSKSDCLRMQAEFEELGFKVVKATQWSWWRMGYITKLTRTEQS